MIPEFDQIFDPHAITGIDAFAKIAEQIEIAEHVFALEGALGLKAELDYLTDLREGTGMITMLPVWLRDRADALAFLSDDEGDSDSAVAA